MELRHFLSISMDETETAKRWIPITELHPVEGQLVLVTDGVFITLTEAYSDTVQVWDEDGVYEYSHWMPIFIPPLPEASYV